MIQDVDWVGPRWSGHVGRATLVGPRCLSLRMPTFLTDKIYLIEMQNFCSCNSDYFYDLEFIYLMADYCLVQASK